MDKCKKKYFDTIFKAETRAIAINVENREKDDSTELRAYKCKDCEGFHLSSMKQGDYHRVQHTIDKHRETRQQHRVEREAQYWLDKFDIDY